MEESRLPTMQQIADAAGVSRMAVSLALRNSPKISQATTERIRKIADDLGYRPNPMVSALMTQLRHSKQVKRPSTLAYVTAYPTADGWRQPGPFVEFFEGACRRAEALGYTLEEWWLRKPGMSERRFSDILYTRNIHGMLVAPLPVRGGTLELNWPRFAAATIGYSVAAPALHRASNDQYGTITLALRELQKLGYRRIGMAMARESDERVKHNWSAGLLVYQQTIAPEDRVPRLLSEGSFPREFAVWYEKHRPQAVVSLTEEVMHIATDIGVKVPQDLGFAHLALTARDTQWAGVNQNSSVVGAAAVDLVDAQLRRNERGLTAFPKTLLVPGQWVPGPSVRQL